MAENVQGPLHLGFSELEAVPVIFYCYLIFTIKSTQPNFIYSYSDKQLRNAIYAEMSARQFSYRGAFSRSNPKWGTTIPVTQKNVWLTTFYSEEEAAKEYDSAILKLRKLQMQRTINIPSHDYGKKIKFQDMYNDEVILHMIQL